MVQIEEVSETNFQYLVDNICEDDRREVLGLGHSVEWGLRHSIDTSIETACITWNGIPVLILGVGQMNPLDDEYNPWLIATDELPKHPVKVMKYSFKILKAWLDKYGKLVNYVDSRHERAVQWLQLLGATLEPAPDHGPYRRLYYKFTFGE
jgi:hypothetical protein